MKPPTRGVVWTIAEDDHRLQSLIRLLRTADHPVSFAEMLDAGIVEPAHALDVLHRAGYRFERVADPRSGGHLSAFRLTHVPVWRAGFAWPRIGPRHHTPPWHRAAAQG